MANSPQPTCPIDRLGIVTEAQARYARLLDRKWAQIRLEGTEFGDVPMSIELCDCLGARRSTRWMRRIWKKRATHKCDGIGRDYDRGLGTVMASRIFASGALPLNWAVPFSMRTPNCFQSESRSTCIG